MGSYSVGSKSKRKEGRIAEEGRQWEYFLGGSLSAVSEEA